MPHAPAKGSKLIPLPPTSRLRPPPVSTQVQSIPGLGGKAYDSINLSLRIVISNLRPLQPLSHPSQHTQPPSKNTKGIPTCLLVSRPSQSYPLISACHSEMVGITSILGFRSSRPEISDDEGSVASASEISTTPVKPEKSQKSKKEEVAEVEEDAMKVESDNEEGDEDDDEVGEDEYVDCQLLHNATKLIQWLSRYVVEKIVSHLFNEEVCQSQSHREPCIANKSRLAN